MKKNIDNCPQLMEYINEVGFLPLLESGIEGFSAEDVVSDRCRYHVLEEGGWEWPLWKWKGPIIMESGCVYGKFFQSKAGFISSKWWPDFCNYRRSVHKMPEEGSVEDTIMEVLRVNGSMITRELRRACGFVGPKMRSRFDSYVTHLQMSCRVVTEDFVYPQDKHGNPYGWGWSLLTTPERLLGNWDKGCDRSPVESHELMVEHLRGLIPYATEKQVLALIG